MIWGLALTCVISLAGMVGLGAVQLAGIHQRAQTSADLAALAAAEPQGEGCEAADRIAFENGAPMVDCTFEAGDAVVTVRAEVPAFMAHLAGWAGRQAPSIEAVARAGLPNPGSPETFP